MATFRLDREGWVPVVDRGGRGEVSLAEALQCAHELTEIDQSNPLVCAAMHSLLQAIVMDLVDLPDRASWTAMWRTGRLPADAVSAYFAEHGARFDLFDERAPFMQVGGLEPLSGGPKPVSLLVPEVATGNNVPLFSSTTEADPDPLTPAEAARRLLACQGFDTAAIKTGAKGDPKASGGKTTGNPVGPLGNLGVVILQGGNLFETLLLNYPIMARMRGDRPTWRQDPLTAQWSIRMPEGPRDLLTWQSRRIRLFPEEGQDGLRVTGVIVAAGDRLPHLPEFEPRSAWRLTVDKKTGAIDRRPVRHQPGRAAWRGMAALVEAAKPGSDDVARSTVLTQAGNLAGRPLPFDYPLRALLIGVAYGNQSAVIEHVIADAAPLPLKALDPDDGERVRQCLEQMATMAEEVMRALNTLDANLRKASGGDPVPWDKGYRPGERFIQQLTIPAGRMLRGLTLQPEQADAAMGAWTTWLRQEAWRIAEPMISEAPPSTFLGHGEGNHESTPMRQQLAEVFFRSALNEALPPTTASRTPEEVSQA